MRLRANLAKALLMLALPTTLAAAPAPDHPQTILFIGNSFTFGALSPVRKYRVDTVTDFNGDGIGGVPALFKLFTVEVGLNYTVSLETSPGKTLAWHWANKAALLDRAWDHVLMQDYSTLDPGHPGDPGLLVDYSSRFARRFAARNSKVEISLTSTWSRPDQTYPPAGA